MIWEAPSPHGDSPGKMRVVAAMSGGVDSSAAAALLQEAGYDVVGVTLRFQKCYESQASKSCCGADGIVRARAVAGQLKIPHYVVDCVDSFERQVLLEAWKEYEAGRTPNPCLLCNEQIKFGTLLLWTREMGASFLATGHYARIARDSEGNPLLRRGKDLSKDQSYFLGGLGRDQLKSVLFPLGEWRKSEVREYAFSRGLQTADAAESQDACLVAPGQSLGEMLQKRFGGEKRPGVFVNEKGEILGRHQGIHRFTLGQRKGLALSSPRRHWVKAISPEDGTVILTTEENLLYSCHFTVREVSWQKEVFPGSLRECDVQIRYRQSPQPVKVEFFSKDSARVIFQQPVRAITPGQAAVFYEGDLVLGRGWIYGC